MLVLELFFPGALSLAVGRGRRIYVTKTYIYICIYVYIYVGFFIYIYILGVNLAFFYLAFFTLETILSNLSSLHVLFKPC